MSVPRNVTIYEDISQKVTEWGLSKLSLCIFLCLVTLTTTLGNGVVLYVFAKSKRALRSPCHILLANLAFADFLVGLLVMPVLLSITIFDWKWYWGDTMCTVGDYIHFVLCATSMFSMVAVCLERYIGIKYPMHHKKILSKKRMRGISASIWIIAFILTAPPLSIWPANGSKSPYICKVNLRHDFIFFISVSLYWIPILILGYMYWLIYKVSNIPSQELMQWAKKVVASTIVSTTSVTSSRRHSKSDEEKFARARMKQTRLLRKMSKLIIVMFLFYGPLFFMFLARGFKVSWFSMDVLLAFGWLRYFSSCTNPFLYIYVVPYYKKQLLKLLCNTSSSQNDKSEGNSSSHLNTDESRSSSSYSSSCKNGTDKTMVNFTQSKSPNIKESPYFVDSVHRVEDKMRSKESTEVSVASPNSSDDCRNIIQEMDDIMKKIDTEIMGPFVSRVG